MPKINMNMQWLIPVGTAVWAVLTWTLDHQRQRRQERARLAAFYVNPLISAIHDLQSRIYTIMKLDGLPLLQKRYPGGAYADETLYLIVRCFGWMMVLERHGPYTKDPVVMRLVSAVRQAFAISTSLQQVGPFNFFHAEQYDLGRMAMTTRQGHYGVEFDTISHYEFKKRLASPPLSDSKSVQETLEALRSADDAGSLPGSNRLAEPQNHLVELVNYLEDKEGYTLVAGERNKCRIPKQLRTVAGDKPLSA